MNISALIKKLLNKGMTQAEIARNVGCSQPTVSDIAKEKIGDPSFSIGLGLIKLAKENGIEVPGIEFLEKEARERPELEGK